MKKTCNALRQGRASEINFQGGPVCNLTDSQSMLHMSQSMTIKVMYLLMRCCRELTHLHLHGSFMSSSIVGVGCYLCIMHFVHVTY